MPCSELLENVTGEFLLLRGDETDKATRDLLAGVVREGMTKLLESAAEKDGDRSFLDGLATLEDSLAESSRRNILLFKDGTRAPESLAAFASVDFEAVDAEEPELGMCCYVVEFHVLPECRRKGFGTRLMDACVEIARRGGARCLRLTCAKNNRRALAFCAVCDFVLDRDSPPARAQKSYVILCRKAL